MFGYKAFQNVLQPHSLFIIKGFSIDVSAESEPDSLEVSYFD